MYTADQIIQQIDALPDEERIKVKQYLLQTPAEEFFACEYTDEEIAEIQRDYQEALQGVNVSRPFHTADDASVT